MTMEEPPDREWIQFDTAGVDWLDVLLITVAALAMVAILSGAVLAAVY